ncbi:MAG: response regulator, partial [Armatimonadetes bacterium]|nr:response regulator [Armatimonadota bacterium]
MAHGHILVVDDEEILLRSLERALTDQGYRVTTAGNAREAIEQARSRDFDLVICDIRLPEVDGLQAVREMQPLQPGARHMLITGYASQEKPVEAIQLGVDDYLLKPFDLDDFLKRVQRVMEKRCNETAREKLAASLEDSLVECLKRLVGDWENEDPFRKGHSDRVVKEALDLGGSLGLSGQQMRILEQAAALHDLGYVALGREILNGQALSKEQWEKVRTHPARGAEILAHAPSLKTAVEAIVAHHENFDGTGYPKGLAGEAIPLSARILRIADMYSALVSSRPHRPACDHGSACKLIEEASGTGLDPVLVSRFLEEGAGEAVPDLVRTARSVLSEFNSRNYRSLLLLARTYGGAGDPESAQQAYTELLSLSRAQRDSEIVFQALLGLATTGLQQNRAEEASHWSRLALEEALQAKESRNTA